MDKHKKEVRNKSNDKFVFNKYLTTLVVLFSLLLIFNQIQIYGITGKVGGSIALVSAEEVYDIKSTSQAIASLFPVGEIQSEEDAIAMMIAQGTPEYGEAMGVTYDDPVEALAILAGAYPALKQQIQNEDSEVWERYLNLATKPVGISCEFCCGVGPTGITKSGDLRCGCKHNPAVQTITLWLMQNTDYDDAQILTEVMKWKALFYPRDMVGLAMKASGGEIDAGNLPGMVGGC